MKRFITLALSLLVAATLFAQSPEAVLKSIEQYPNHAVTIGSTYPSIPLGEVANAPKGFKPFYFSMVGRHGSRYETEKHLICYDLLKIYDKADKLGILTADGKALHKQIAEICKAQKDNDGEISALGMKQWEGIAQRTYDRFGSIFRSGNLEAKSSTSMRCVLSMVSFNQTIKGLYPKINIYQNSREVELQMLRPLVDNPYISKDAKDLCKEYRTNGPWKKERNKFLHSADASSFISKVTTNREAFINECGAKSDMNAAYLSFYTLLFAENFEKGDRALLTRLFTPKEMYNVYVYKTSMWVNAFFGRGNEYVEMRQSHMRPLIEDILNKAQAAVDGKNPDVANLRFTHDSYVGPLLSVIGYEGCVPQWSEDIEKAATSFNHALISPMAANLQIVLYRNKKGEVLVRSLLNERDAYLPIKCETAPFYPWSDFCNHINNNMNYLDGVQKRVLQKHGK